MECKKDLFYIFPLNLGDMLQFDLLACFSSGWLDHHLALVCICILGSARVFLGCDPCYFNAWKQETHREVRCFSMMLTVKKGFPSHTI